MDPTADVVVAGAGLAGLMAAIEAAEAGAKVIVLEPSATVGGRSARAIGTFTASETALQRAAGIADSHQEHVGDMARLAATIGMTLDRDRALRRVREDSATIARLIGLGVAFGGPHPEAPHGKPRMHMMLPGPEAAIETLLAHARRAGAELRTGVALVDVVLKGQNLEAVCEGGGRSMRAGAIVLASGAALDLARRVGAKMETSGRTPLPQLRAVSAPHVEPSPRLFELGAELVVRGDEQFVVIGPDCAARLATAADDVGPGRDGWQLSGKPFVCTAPGIAYAYLDDCRRWVWYQEAGSNVVLGPFKRLVPGDGVTIATDDAMRALGVDGAPIAGLYAVGDAALWFEYAGGHGYGLSWAATSGRIAGQSAAALARTMTTRAAP